MAAEESMSTEDGFVAAVSRMGKQQGVGRIGDKKKAQEGRNLQTGEIGRRVVPSSMDIWQICASWHTAMCLDIKLDSQGLLKIPCFVSVSSFS